MAKRKQVPKKKNTLSKSELKKNEQELEKKKKELQAAKAKYKKLAREFIDIWVKTKRAKRGVV